MENFHGGSPLDQSGSPNVSMEGSFWKPSAGGNGNAAAAPPNRDFSPVLRNLCYALSVPMPGQKNQASSESGKASAEGDATSPASQERNRLLHLVADPLEIVSWLENLRVYTSETILNRVSGEIRRANKALAKLGLDVQVGESGLEKVKRAAAMHFTQQGSTQATRTTLTDGEMRGKLASQAFLSSCIIAIFLASKWEKLYKEPLKASVVWSLRTTF